MVGQAPDPLDRAQPRLSARQPITTRRNFEKIPTTGCSGGCERGGSTPRRSATPCCGQRPTRTSSGPRLRRDGPGQRPVRSGGVKAGRKDSSNVRSVYLPISATGVPDMLQVFDMADPNLIFGKRDVTTVPTQALYLMNNPFVLKQAEQMAERVWTEQGLDQDGAHRLAYRLASAGRRPTSEHGRGRSSQASIAIARRGRQESQSAVRRPGRVFARRCSASANSATCTEARSRSSRPRATTMNPAGFPQIDSLSRRDCSRQPPAASAIWPWPTCAPRRRPRPTGSGIRWPPRPPHFKPRAKRVIFLFMQGAPSHVDTFDYKPAAASRRRQDARGQGKGASCSGSPFKFAQHGKSGTVAAGDLSQPGRACRRPVPAEQHVHRRGGASAGDDPAAHRQFPLSAAVDGRLDRLRLGTRKHGAARLHHDQSGRRRPQSYGSSFLPASYQGTKIEGVGGKRRTPQPGGQHRESQAHARNCSASSSTCWPR